MKVSEAIRTRRSIRSFLDKPVEHSVLRSILSDAIHAPTASDAQPWAFVVVEEPTLIEAASRLNPFADWAKNAPLGVLVCGLPDAERQTGTWVQDCSALTQNILLLSHERGFGATWTGVHPVKSRIESFSAIFNLPPQVIPFSFVLIGYPGRQPAEKVRTLDGKLHFNQWKDTNRSLSPSEAEKTICSRATAVP